MGWKIIKIESESILKTYLENLQIIQTDKKILIPISDIDTLLIDNTKIRFSVNIINKLTSYNVNVILCNNKHLPQTFCLPVNGNIKSYEVFRKQLEWTNEYKDQCWNWIMKYKCYNQLMLIRDKYDIKNWLTKIFEDNINFKEQNIESQIANLFFHQLFGQSFNRKDESNLINSILDYGYTIITSLVCRSIISKGLNQHISFFHGSNISTFPLAFDIVELFRVLVDYFVNEMIKNNIIHQTPYLSKNIKDCFLEYISNIKILVDNQYQFLNNSIDMVIDWFINKSFNEHSLDIISVLLNRENYEE